MKWLCIGLAMLFITFAWTRAMEAHMALMIWDLFIAGVFLFLYKQAADKGAP